MAKLIIISGLPGSGKTHYLDNLIASGVIDEDRCYDDFHAGAYNDSPTVESSRWFIPLVSNLRAGNDCIVSDIEFCLKSRRDNLIEAIRSRVPSTKLEIRCFENKPGICRTRVLARGGESTREEIGNIARLSRDYDIPKDAVVLKVNENTDTSSKKQ